MSKTITIQSYTGPYQVEFKDQLQDVLSALPQGKNLHAIIDEKVYGLYKEAIDKGPFKSKLFIEANENTKSLSSFTEIIENLLANGAKRGETLVAIGGGITQDITCFLSATLFRGIDWYFIPTTLLAQADSCIGSKSSINVGSYKNILGTFTPPKRIFICTQVLKTLASADIHSGIGEMIKVHMIDSPKSFQNLEKDYQKILSEFPVMEKYIEASLLIKKKLIEEDEFDKGIRNILNYGHSFGHAIESATDFRIPHGIAVTMGMDMANFTAAKMGFWSMDQFQACHNLLVKNSDVFYRENVPVESFIKAIAKDKKNTASHLTLILPHQEGKLEKTPVLNDSNFQNICQQYLTEVRLT